MTKLVKILLIVLFGLMLGLHSCTIKKRLYQPGYHVDWHKPNIVNNTVKAEENASISKMDSDGQPAVEISDIHKQQPVVLFCNNDSENLYANKDETVIYNELVASKPELPNSTILENVAASEYKTENGKSKQIFLNVENDGKKIHYAAIIGLALCILGFGIIPFVVLATNIGMLIVIAGTSPLSMVLGFLFAIYAKDIIKSNPDKYTGMLLVKISLIMCIVYAALILVGAIVRFWN